MNLLVKVLSQMSYKPTVMLTLSSFNHNLYYNYRNQYKRQSMTNIEFRPEILCFRKCQMYGHNDNHKTIDEISEEMEKCFVRIKKIYGYKTDLKERALQGSGIIVGNGTYIVTNYHMCDNSSELSVCIFKRNKKRDLVINRTQHKLHIVFTDPTADLALLKVTSGQILGPGVTFSTDRVESGQHVVSIGNPTILYSLCDGIIICSERKGETICDGNYGYYMNLKDPNRHFVCHNCLLYNGFSGGPLMDTSGRVVGVNWGGLLTHKEFFAISSEVINDFVKTGQEFELQENVKTLNRYSYRETKSLGIAVRVVSGKVAFLCALYSHNNQQDMGPSTAKRSKVELNEFRRRDIIWSFNTTTINSVKDLRDCINGYNDSNDVVIRVYRSEGSGGKFIDLKVPLKSVDCPII